MSSSGSFQLIASFSTDTDLGVSGLYVRRKLDLNGKYILRCIGFTMLGQQFYNYTNGGPIFYLTSPNVVNPVTFDQFVTSMPTGGLQTGQNFMGDVDQLFYADIPGYLDFNCVCGSSTNMTIPTSGSMRNGTNGLWTGATGMGTKVVFIANFTYHKLN